jgi:hypothetical protein
MVVKRLSYTFHAVGNVTREGKPILLGSAIYSTDSSGKVEVDATGDFLSKARVEVKRNWQKV